MILTQLAAVPFSTVTGLGVKTRSVTSSKPFAVNADHMSSSFSVAKHILVHGLSTCRKLW